MWLSSALTVSLSLKKKDYCSDTRNLKNKGCSVNCMGVERVATMICSTVKNLNYSN